MIPIKTAQEIQKMRTACRVAADVLNQMACAVKVGITTYELDQLAKEHIQSAGAKSACYQYRLGNKVFPAYTCISVNNEVVHGIGSTHRILEDGDIVSLDVCVIYDGFVGDNAKTVLVGSVDKKIVKMVQTTQFALQTGIDQVKPGVYIGDISSAIQHHVESAGFSVVRDFVGHGVGRSMHEEPQIPNFGSPRCGPKLKPGMTLAIEPMVNLGLPGVHYAADGWTALTNDGLPSAHFEHTVLVTHSGAEVLTISN